ncbi:secretin N-terminal domain-containing protein [Chitinimonas lacunae]|uniref:Secretin N-terminal domain-containing protein n=1 Tax=Chitinimonas lacunae TaxID=1963018 RepID=A0ABV8MWM3_9NEIS
MIQADRRLLPLALLGLALGAGADGTVADPTSALLPVPAARATKPLPPGESRPAVQPLARADDRFNLIVNGAPAAQVYLAMVQDTPYQMLLPADFSGTISVQLNRVTVPEALAVLKELYGYDYRIDGQRITMLPLSVQTRLYQLNYLNTNRRGASEVRVLSGSIVTQEGDSGSSSASTSSDGSSTEGSSSSLETTRLSTQSQADLWREVSQVLTALVGPGEGRGVTVSPNTGIVVVRALPSEHAQVSQFLRQAEVSLARQVILEAKIVEVSLGDGYRQGINWAAFGTLKSSSDTAFSFGFLGGKMTATPLEYSGGNVSGRPERSLSNNTDNPLFGLVLRADNFTAAIDLLEQQGTVQVLSSPRIATLNNQKAVLKVGTDELFLTGIRVNSTTSTTGGNATVIPELSLRPFFSGIALDVTPQIDEQGSVILHVRPSVSEVNSVNKRFDLGDLGTYTLPLASSRVSETDSVIRAQDGQIVAIGGLVRERQGQGQDAIPGLGRLPVVGGLFRSEQRMQEKRELVFLLKPIVVRSAETWQRELAASDQRIDAIAGPTRTIRLP